jgi:hypothetical protein
MLTNERLEEMRQAEMMQIQRPHQHEGVRARSIELAEALTELLTYREMMERVPQVKITLEGSERELAATVAETGASPQIVQMGGAGFELVHRDPPALGPELWGQG